MKPSEGQAGPLAALAGVLAEALPELAQGDYPTPAMLADMRKRTASLEEAFIGRAGPVAKEIIGKYKKDLGRA